MTDQNTPFEETPQGWNEDSPDAFTQLRTHSKSLAQSLREKEQNEAALAAELEGYRKRDKFAEALLAAGVEGVTFEDVADLTADQITPTALRVRAEEKQASKNALLADQAKAAGFETVEAYQTALQKLGAMSADEKQALVSQGQAATAGSAPPQTTTLQERAHAAYRASKATGSNDETARAAYAQVMMEDSES